MSKKEAKIEVDDVNLEDLIVLGENKLVDIIIDYPTEEGSVKTKAKIKQLTIKELKNVDVTNPSLEANIDILCKSLYTQKGDAFSRDLILSLPVGVVNAISAKIMEISGVNRDLGF